MKSKTATVFAILLMVISAVKTLAQGNPPAYLAEMPSVERVMQAMQTSDPDETAARQMAAFTHLKNMIEKLAGPRFPKNQLTPEGAAGHSLGEYTALAASGVIDFDTALGLVALRGRAMASGKCMANHLSPEYFWQTSVAHENSPRGKCFWIRARPRRLLEE